MWKPQPLPRLRAAVYEPVVTTRMLVNEMLNRMSIVGIQTIQSEDDVAAFSPSLSVDIVVMEHSTAADNHERAITVYDTYLATFGASACMIFTTNDARESNIQAAIAKGCDGIVLRPFSPRSFCDRVSWAVQRKQARANQFVVAA